MLPLSIYIHWPFCLSKCPYCDFFSLPLQDAALYKKIGTLLLKDLEFSFEKFFSNKSDGRCECDASGHFDAQSGCRAPLISSIFFGGGTPSLMPLETLDTILSYLYKNFSLSEGLEISLEANPATFDAEKLRAFKRAGINRLSLGIQSFLDENLRFLGRPYDGEAAFHAAELVAQNFENFNFDFIYAYAPQTLQSFEDDLKRALLYGPKHLSCYELTYEENTPLFVGLKNGKIKDISETRKIQFFKFAEKFLSQAGLKKYEISNFACPGFECQHNLNYWKSEDFLGIGPAACSRITCQGLLRSDSLRTLAAKQMGLPAARIAIEKPRDLEKWSSNYKNPKIEILSSEMAFEEFLIMGLRLVSGLDLEDLRYRFSVDFESFLSTKKLKFLTEQKFIKKTAIARNRLELTLKGRLYLNSVVDVLCME